MAHDAFGDVLHSLRARQRIKQSELATQLNVHRNTVGAWERGDYLPDLTTVHELARVLQLSEDDAQTLFAAHSTKSPVIIPWNLPSLRNRLFTGREQLLQKVHEALQASPQGGACALSGLAGMGKTQTALEYAYRFQQAYRCIFWIQAETYETILGSYLTIAELLDLPEKQEADQSQVEKAVNRWLQTHAGWLLIYDNVEDIALLGQVLPVTRSGAILLTTRAQATGGMFTSLEVEAMAPQEASLLLLRRARLVQGDQSITLLPSEEQASAATLAEQVGRLPLALDQAGAYIEENKCSVGKYLALYQNHRQVLLRERGSLPSNHPASVESTFLMAFDKVEQRSPAAADLLRFCAFLAPEAIPEELLWQARGIPDPALPFLALDTLKLNVMFRDLLNYSLIQRHPGTQTISLHRLVQEVLRGEMDQQSRGIWIERAILRVHELFPWLESEVHVEDWAACERLLPHVLVCVAWSEQGHGILPDAALLYLNAADYLRERGLFAQAVALTRRALEIRIQIWGPEHLEITECLNNLGLLYRVQGNYVEAEQFHRQALAIRERHLGPTHMLVAESLSNAAVVVRYQAKYGQAEAFLQRALTINEQLLGPTHPRTAAAMFQLALVYMDEGKYTEAESLHRRVIDIREQVLGPSHPHTAGSLNRLGDLYRQMGKYAEAESLLQRAQKTYEQQLGPDHISTARTQGSLGQLFLDLGRYEEAEPLLQRALELHQQTLGPTNPDTTVYLLSLADLYRHLAKYEQAMALCQNALVATEQVLGMLHPRAAECLALLGMIYRDWGRMSEAEMLFDRALSTARQTLGDDHPLTRKIVQNRSQTRR